MRPGRYAVAGLPLIGDGPSSVLIRNLNLKVGRVELIQTTPGAPARLEEQLNFSGTYQNVRKWENLLSAELLQRLARARYVAGDIVQWGDHRTGRIRRSHAGFVGKGGRCPEFSVPET